MVYGNAQRLRSGRRINPDRFNFYVEKIERFAIGGKLIGYIQLRFKGDYSTLPAPSGKPKSEVAFVRSDVAYRIRRRDVISNSLQFRLFISKAGLDASYYEAGGMIIHGAT